MHLNIISLYQKLLYYIPLLIKLSTKLQKHAINAKFKNIKVRVLRKFSIFFKLKYDK